MNIEQLKKGDVVRVNALTQADIDNTSVRPGDLVTVHAGLNQIVQPHKEINEMIHGTPNVFGVVMAFSESGEGFLISQANEVELVSEGE